MPPTRTVMTPEKSLEAALERERQYQREQDAMDWNGFNIGEMRQAIQSATKGKRKGESWFAVVDSKHKALVLQAAAEYFHADGNVRFRQQDDGKWFVAGNGYQAW